MAKGEAVPRSIIGMRQQDQDRDKSAEPLPRIEVGQRHQQRNATPVVKPDGIIATEIPVQIKIW